ncbi:response regulator [Streptomyces sp. NPDC001185]|uniref:response regulator n=1 Tax=Streptomyces sp. NPDC001185 TaxID=3154380 RepID=UPI0033203942
MRIVIAEDLALLREGLIRIFQANDFEVVDAVDNGPSLIRALTTLRPDVAVVDVRLPPTFTDLRAVIDVRKQIRGLPIVGQFVANEVRKAPRNTCTAVPGEQSRKCPSMNNGW